MLGIDRLDGVLGIGETRGTKEETPRADEGVPEGDR